MLGKLNPRVAPPARLKRGQGDNPETVNFVKGGGKNQATAVRNKKVKIDTERDDKDRNKVNHQRMLWKAINSLIWAAVGNDDLVRIHRATRTASNAEIVSANILVEAGGRGTDKCADCIQTPSLP